MVTMESDKVERKEDTPTLISLKILPILKERQLQHGLRHGDYQRYHGYCSRRLRRLREVLKMPQGDRRHFKRKDVGLAEIEGPKNGCRYLEIPLTLVERCWASAMELKQDANTEPRKRFHVVSRLRKAIALVDALLLLCQSNKVDARTKLECEAYHAFIYATLNFETEQWSKAINHFKKAQAIYSQISGALGDHSDAAYYTEKNTEMFSVMRFCAYKTGADLNISELSSEFQSAAIKDMIAQKPKLSEIKFRQYTLSIPNEKIMALIVQIDQFKDKENKKIEMYEEILVDLRDIVQMVRDMIKVDQQAGKTSKHTMLLSYLIYLRLRLTNSRTLLMMEEKSSPKDCIRLAEMVLHNLNEMKSIAKLDGDEDFQREIEDEILVFKGVRCKYLAKIYSNAKKWQEALLLYNKGQDYLNKAKKIIPPTSDCIDVIAKYAKEIKRDFIECKAQALLNSKEGEGFGTLQLTRPNKPLLNRLDEYILDESLISGEPNLCPFPPDYEPTFCKPVFFDLALNHVTLPVDEIGEKAGVTPKKSSPKDSGGLSGFVKGLWGWGSR